MKTISTILAAAALVTFSACNRSDSPDVVAESTATDSAIEQTKEASTHADVSALPLLGLAPDWVLKRLDGSTMSSADLVGKVVVLDFWATWCPPCREEIPGYIEMQRELEASGLVIVGISLDQGGVGVVENFGQQFKINYPLVMGDQAIVEAFGGIEAIPTTFLVDRNGQIRHRKVGMMTRSDYEPLVRSLL
jgi:thiol-disulfide isomerase/thioredoxin